FLPRIMLEGKAPLETERTKGRIPTHTRSEIGLNIQRIQGLVFGIGIARIDEDHAPKSRRFVERKLILQIKEQELICPVDKLFVRSGNAIGDGDARSNRPEFVTAERIDATRKETFEKRNGFIIQRFDVTDPGVEFKHGTPGQGVKITDIAGHPKKVDISPD